MIQLVPQLRILLACHPVDFRKGIDSLAALCRAQLNENPLSGTLFVFRNRSGTALKLLVHDGQGFWLCLRRFSQGRLRWWPRAADAPLHPLEAQQLSVLLYNGLPDKADFADAWRKIDSATFSQAARASASSASVSDHVLCSAEHNTCYPQSRIMRSTVGERVRGWLLIIFYCA